MRYMSKDRIREEQVRRLRTDEDPRRRQRRPKTRDRGKEERLRIKLLAYEQASD